MKNRKLGKIPQVKKINLIAQKRKINIWLVGGFLRDVYLKVDKDLTDFDFAVEKNAKQVARDFAQAIGGKLIPLDKKVPSFRVVYTADKIYTYDFTFLRKSNIKEDLFWRDFTINTLAVNLSQPEKELDYYGGKKDLRNKKIKALSEGVIIEDPLRILRGFSFAAGYGFKIEAKTLAFFSRHKKKITKVSAERVNQELFKIFSASFSYKIIRKMDAFKVTDEILPCVGQMRKTTQGGFHHLNVWEHSIETLKQFELLYQRRIRKKEEIKSYLDCQLAKGRKRIQILKIACLLHDLGKPFAKKKEKNRMTFHKHEKISKEICAEFATKLRLSKNEKASLEKMVFCHLRPGYLADQVTPGQRAVYRFFRDTQQDGASIVLLSLADWRATRGVLTDPLKRKRHERIMLKLVENYFIKKQKKPLPKFINGRDLMSYFDLKPGPLIGQILARIKELQALGKIEKKEQALKAAEKMLKQKSKPAKRRENAVGANKNRGFRKEKKS